MSEGVSLYVPCYEAAGFLEEVLPAVFAQSHPLLEVLVVDDGSRDGTAELAERLGKQAPVPLRVIRHPHNRGLAAARNTGVREARGEFVASIDADVLVEPGWLAALMAEFTEPDIVGAGGELIERNVRGMANHWRDTHMRQSHGAERREDPPFLYGANNVFRREVLLAAGLYDERCRTNGEDVAMSAKLRACGGRLVYTPAARAHHLRQDGVRSILATWWRWAYFGNWHEVSLRRTRKSLLRNFRRSWRRCLAPDARAGDLSNVAVDLLQPFYAGYADSREYLRRRRQAARQEREGAACRARIDAACPGWSKAKHWRTFRRILGENGSIREVCVLGVYLGRDIAYLGEIFRSLGREYRIVGVDRFADVPGEDWPEAQRKLSWEEAGFGPAPQLEQARAHLAELGLDAGVELIQGEMDAFLEKTDRDFDFIYIDVSHDYETTRRAIQLARRRLRPGGILGGDDYSDQGTWGVARAVRELCPDHEVHNGWLWTSRNAPPASAGETELELRSSLPGGEPR